MVKSQRLIFLSVVVCSNELLLLKLAEHFIFLYVYAACSVLRSACENAMDGDNNNGTENTAQARK